ncbi:hypothetical protein [Rhodopirellula sp. MGV]|uniref:hypothetical protein n=1 Tax=Rhodopirellula sp. MGV TaxID=2023130 RepID=UPI000B96FD17|nr:hypothetical protein [Rhodopirellula sp. MGV]OYP35846.1 hypothetical protein CGZ80_10670 [Rhodopirellula sp. MGV]PNY37223.1 hypothetical protein C2E31_08945 [Rhodopirellula baltica]
MSFNDEVPFGLPCLRRVGDIGTSEFIDLDDESNESVIRTPPSITRLIVGEPGAGKTRTLLQHPFAEDAVNIGIVDVGLHPDTEGVMGVHRALRPVQANTVEYWEKYWRMATIRAIATHILFGREKNGNGSSDIEALRTFVTRARATSVPVCVTDSLTHICQGLMTRNEFREYYHSDEFARATVAVEQALRSGSRFPILLDVSDEVLDNAPVAWSECLQGLMFFVLSSKSDSLFHSVDLVATSSARVHRAATRQPRYFNYSSRADIMTLAWEARDAKRFLSRKVSSLPTRFKFTHSSSDELRDWLGVGSIMNRSRNRREKVADYVVRHTRLMPRQIICIGNELCRSVQHAKRAGGIRIGRETIHGIVHKSVRDFAREMILDCSCELVLQGIARQFKRSSLNVYDGSNEDIVGNGHALKRLLNGFQSEQAKIHELRAAILRELTENEATADDVLQLLWQRRFFGVIEQTGTRKSSVRFCNRSQELDWASLSNSSLQFNTLIIDAVNLFTPDSMKHF